jgi:glycosyltransferase involved in cell wall biosynthesis
VKRVLLLADQPGWAYDVICRGIAPHLDRYQPTIRYVADVAERKVEVDFADYDVVHALFWHDLYAMERGFYGHFDPRKVVVGVHAVNSWVKRRLSLDAVRRIVDRYAAVGAVSAEIERALRGCRVVRTPSGFDPALFTPSPMPATVERLRVLWAGSTANHGRLKGLDDLIRPALRGLRDVDLSLATHRNPLPHDRMPEFYRSGHVYVCMSESEGSPLPVIEAMACGRPVVSTAVGVVPELVRDGVNGLIVGRSRESLRAALQRLREFDLAELGRAARAAVEDRTWSPCAQAYQALFDRVA